VSFPVSFYGSVSNSAHTASCCSVPDKLESILKGASIAYSRNHPDVLKDELKPTIKIFVLPGYYTTSSGNSSQTFRDNLSVPSPRGPLKMGPTGCPETSVRNHEKKLQSGESMIR